MAGLRLRLLDLFQKHYGKLLLALVLFLLFSYDHVKTAHKGGVSLFVFADMATMDFHYVTFAGLPIYGWFLFSSLPNDLSAELLRHRRFRDYFWVEFAPIAVFTFLYSALPTLTALFLGLVTGLPLHSDATTFFTNSLTDQYSAVVPALIHCTGHSAALTAFLVMLYQFVGLTFFALAVRFMLYALPKKIALGAAVAAYLFDVIAVQFGFAIPYVYLNNYFVLSQALVKDSVFPSLLIMLVLSGLMALALRKRWGFGDICSESRFRAAVFKSKQTRRHSPAFSMLQWTWLRCYSNRRTAVAAAVLLGADFLYLLSEGNHSLCDKWLILFEGYGLGWFDLKRLLFLLLVNGLPLYFAALSLDEQSSKVGSHVMVRQRKKTAYFLWGQLAYTLFLLCSSALHFVSALLHTLFFGGGVGFGDYWLALRTLLPTNANPAVLLLMSAVLRWAELLLWQAVMVLLHCLTNRLSGAFVIIMSGYLSVCLVTLPHWPFGLSSILRWTTLGGNWYANFALCLTIFAVPLMAIYRYILRKGVYALTEQS